MFAPDQLAQWTGGRWTAQPVSPLSGFATDSRTLRPGQVFVALQTAQRDGHEFLLAAAAAGASAALVQRRNPALALPQLVVADPLAAFQQIAREHRRQFRGPVIGITGSCGKTSTKELLALLLGGEAGGVLATTGNLNNHLGVPLTLTRLDPAAHRFAVVEAGISAPGEMDVLAGMIEPDLALVTLVAPAHLQELGSVEGVAAEKARLPAAVRPAGVAIFPNDCTQFSAFRELGVRTMVIEPAEVVRPTEPPKDKVYFAVTQRNESTAIAIAYGAPPPFVFRMRRISAGMAQNATLAICTALWLGVSPADIQQRLEHWQPVQWRGELRRAADRLLYLDFYNANPASMADAVDTFCALTPVEQPRLFVLGCMEELGSDAARYHRELGRSLPVRADDRVIVIGGEAASVAAGAREQGGRDGQIEVVTALEPVTARIAGWRGSVFVKGSRRYQLEKTLAPELVGAAHH
ncbi:MAG: UDP-N-acetylmuramoyl-tripeptide--D-alanyl-D-alanine ligase [Opitutae bacterium]|nr:UDP-N-acetylmuramoyl-tripeptide--D-alanyl-D-alanine ligase [Opitutae bacterium]